MINEDAGRINCCVKQTHTHIHSKIRLETIAAGYEEIVYVCLIIFCHSFSSFLLQKQTLICIIAPEHICFKITCRIIKKGVDKTRIEEGSVWLVAETEKNFKNFIFLSAIAIKKLNRNLLIYFLLISDSTKVI